MPSTTLGLGEEGRRGGAPGEGKCAVAGDVGEQLAAAAEVAHDAQRAQGRRAGRGCVVLVGRDAFDQRGDLRAGPGVDAGTLCCCCGCCFSRSLPLLRSLACAIRNYEGLLLDPGHESANRIASVRVQGARAAGFNAPAQRSKDAVLIINTFNECTFDYLAQSFEEYECFSH